MAYQMGVEELAFALTLLGEKVMAQGLLQAHFGNVSEEEIRQRFIAVSHSLMARGLLAFSETDQTLALSPELVTTLRLLAHPQYTLRMSCLDRDGEHIRAYHFHQTGMVAQTLERSGLVYTLEPFSSTQSVAKVVQDGSEMFHLTERSGEVIEVVIGQQAFSMLTRTPRKESLSQKLIEEGIPLSLAEMIDEDFQEERFRGSVLRLDYKNGEAVSDFGIVIFGAQKRTWLGRVLPLEGKILLREADPQVLREELLLLMEKRYRK